MLKRRDVRGQFLPNPIPDQVLARLLNAAHRAPSVGFMQPWDFIVVRDGAIKQRVAWGAKGHLRPFVEGFIGTKLHDDEAYNFNLEELLGDVCLLNVVHTEKDGNTYANIQGASPLPKGMTAPNCSTGTNR